MDLHGKEKILFEKWKKTHQQDMNNLHGELDKLNEDFNDTERESVSDQTNNLKITEYRRQKDVIAQFILSNIERLESFARDIYIDPTSSLSLSMMGIYFSKQEEKSRRIIGQLKNTNKDQKQEINQLKYKLCISDTLPEVTKFCFATIKIILSYSSYSSYSS